MIGQNPDFSVEDAVGLPLSSLFLLFFSGGRIKKKFKA